MSAIFSFDPPVRTRRAGIVAGVAVSLLLHVVVLFGYRVSSPPPPKPALRSIAVWLRMRPPDPKFEPWSVADAAAKARHASAKPRPRNTPAPQPDAAVQAAVQAAAPVEAPATPQAITVPREQDPLYADQQPKQFNMDQALKTARSVAKEKAQPGTLTAQLENHPLYPEDNQTKLQKGVADAKKYDCLQAGASMGILAPLAWAFDKHCKF